MRDAFILLAGLAGLGALLAAEAGNAAPAETAPRADFAVTQSPNAQGNIPSLNHLPTPPPAAQRLTIRKTADKRTLDFSDPEKIMLITSLGHRQVAPNGEYMLENGDTISIRDGVHVLRDDQIWPRPAPRDKILPPPENMASMPIFGPANPANAGIETQSQPSGQ